MTKKQSQRYVVGIDLGTTNTALAYVDTQTGEGPLAFPIPQIVAQGQVAPRATLPSFLYLAAGEKVPEGAFTLPWGGTSPGDEVVGEHARHRGAEVPMRLVASAKSWLCHPSVDRTAAILPWGAEGVEKRSPVDASSRYLAHLVGAWDDAHPEARLKDQDVFLTVPASFDPVARELTVEAAQRAGLAKVTLLEEPQAAFYAWLAQAGDGWRKQLGVGDLVLVCDVGGGTSDFSLITVADRGGDLALERVAVGEHILLGGDNMDLALAYAVMQKLAAKGTKLDAWQQRQLTSACRAAKEQLLALDGPAEAPIAILGRSSKLIGGTIRTELTRAEVETTLVDGFFPRVGADATPQRGKRAGFQELGLPYAADAAITRHLAEFVARAVGRAPTAILENGGVMKGAVLRQRLVETVGSWGNGLKELGGTDLDLAVAHGAAYAGWVRRGKGIRIRGGSARSYYLGIETAMPAVPGMPPPIKALCVVPFGLEEGSRVEIPKQELGLVVGEPAEFRFLGSTQRQTDTVGTMLDDVDELDELAPVMATLPASSVDEAGKLVPVRLEAHLTEIGTLELWCVADAKRRWKLEWNVRG